MRVLGLVAICEILDLEVAEEELLCARTGAAAERGSEDVPGGLGRPPLVLFGLLSPVPNASPRACNCRNLRNPRPRGR